MMTDAKETDAAKGALPESTRFESKKATRIIFDGERNTLGAKITAINRVAVAGAGGELGVHVLRALLESGLEVTVLNRSPGKVTPEFTSRVTEQIVDFSFIPSIVDALRDQQALVITVGMQTLPIQVNLVHAAVKAGVKRVIPSLFTCDLNHFENRILPVFGEKVHVEKLLEEKARNSATTFTFIYNNAFLDWGLQHRFFVDAVDRKATLFDGGDIPISFTRLATVGRAVASVLGHFDETKNRRIYIHDGKISLKSMLESLKELSPGQKWAVQEESTLAIKTKSDEALINGIIDPWVWFGYVFRGTMSPETASFNNVDNELLGIDLLSEDQLKDEIKEIVRKIL